MPDLSVPFACDGYWFGPGPTHFVEPFYSFAVMEIEEYSPASIAAAILAIPGSRELHPPIPSWWKWQALWEREGRQILMDDVYLSEESEVWMQLRIMCDCRLADVLDLWAAIQVRHPAVWIYGDDSRVYSPASFIAKWAGPCEGGALPVDQPLL